VDWILRKLDAFLGAAAIAVTGIAASQGQAFIVQYLQRLGGHLDEAKAQLANVQTGLRYKLMNESVRKELENEAQRRAAELQSAYDAIAHADIFTKPFALFRHADSTIMAGTWHDFVPALSLGAESVTYIIVGMVAGFIVYEVVKLPFVALLQEPRRRKFRRRA
jgi:hypothetical protein